VRFHSREIDAVSFWDRYVQFPSVMDIQDEFAPLVMCPNPEHDNFRSPAFQVNLQRPFVHCFSHCGISGTWEHAVCVIEGLYEKFAVEEAITKQERLRRKNRAQRAARSMILLGATGISRRSHLAPTKKRPIKKQKFDYERYLPQVAWEYLESRGIEDTSISYWELGWLPDEKRIVIPAHDENGKLKFLIKRAVLPQQQPKYLYSENSSKTSILFGAGKARFGPTIVLTEGSLDVIRLNQHGISALGILGTGISDAQVKILARMRPRRVCLMFDKDIAGVRNVEIAMEKLRKYPLFICRYPAGKSDPAELSKEQALRSVERAVPALLWKRKVRKKIGLDNRPRV
jgi:hypothetical protein